MNRIIHLLFLFSLILNFLNFSNFRIYALDNNDEIIDVLDNHEHFYISEITNPTCINNGYTTYSCEGCGDVYVDNYIEKLGHDLHLCDDEIIVIKPTYTSVGWQKYECCTNDDCSYYTLKVISSLGDAEITSFNEFITNLEILESYAHDYIRDISLDSDPLMLILKYINTDIDIYRSGLFNSTLNDNDISFAKYVRTRETEYNKSLISESEFIKVTGLKNLRSFVLPNGNKSNFARLFAILEVGYTNKVNMDYMDAASWIGDIVNLVGILDQYSISSTLFDEMIEEIETKYFLKDGNELMDIYGEAPINGSFSNSDFQNDLDAFYLLHNLMNNNYKCGNLSELFTNYMDANLSDIQRYSYMIKNRLDNASLRNDLRSKIFELYSSNSLVSSMESSLELTCNGEKLNNLRKAACYVVADYLCKNAGDYTSGINEFISIIESNTINLAPGISQTINRANTVDGKQMDYYVATIDTNRPDVDVYTNYKNNDPYISVGLPYNKVEWQATRVLDQANAAQKRHSNPNDTANYIPNFNVVAAINGSGFYIETGEPGELLVMEGTVVHDSGETDFFGIKTDGTPIIGTYKEYKALMAKGEIRDAISAHHHRIVKDGKNAILKTSDYISKRTARSAVGITKTGKVVFVVVDGRQGELSCGISLVELAQLMIDSGCVEALNLDGGGSSTYVAKLPDANNLEVLNYPSEGAPRAVSSSFYVVSTAPRSTAFDHAVLEADYTYLTVGSKAKLTASAISTTGNTIDLPEGTVWKVVESDLAEITQEGVFIAKANGIVTVNLTLDGVVIGSKKMYITVLDNATGGDYQFAFERVVSNSSTGNNSLYYAIDPNKDMVTEYTFAIDMSKIDIPAQLKDLTYMLPGTDMENESAWNYLLQLAERVSALTTVEPVLVFDKDVDVDISELSVSNEYFKLEGTTFDEEANSLTLHLRWVKQSKPIDPDTTNPLCILTGIKLTPKADANWGSSQSLNIVNTASIGYEIFLRANELYSFSQKLENQKTFGLYPFENTLTDPVERGGSFKSVYKEFSDEYTLSKAIKDGWVMESGGWAYYEDGAKYTGIKKVPVDGLYYDFGENGINVGQKPYTGDFFDGGKEYFVNEGKFYIGWRIVSMKDVRYYDEKGVRENLDRKEIPSTCIEDGECTYTRSNGEVKKIEYDDAGGHEYVKQDNGDYKCSVCGHVRIEMSEVTVTLSANLFTYTGGIRQPGTTAVSKDGRVLTKAPTPYPDYASTYKNNVNVGTGTVTLTAQRYGIYVNMTEWRGNAKGSITLEYEIRPDLPTNINLVEDAEKVVLSWDAAKAEYMLTDNDANTDLVYVIYKVDKTGQAVELTTTKDLTKTLTGAEYKGAQFKIGTRATVKGKTYESINLSDGIATKLYVTTAVTEAGKPKLTWNDIPNGVSYEILRANSKNGKYAQVYTTENNSYTHTSAEAGNTYYYKVRVVFKDGTKLTSDIVSCTAKAPEQPKPENPTIPTVSSVTRVFGASRYETSFKVANTLKDTLGVDKFETVIIANGTNFADALAGSYLAAKNDAPILMTDKNAKNIVAVQDYIKANVKKGGTVYILGGTAALPNTIDKGLAGYKVKRLAGKDRYETNLLILEEAEVTSEAILVATGTGFADSLSASATGLPILLVNKNLNKDQKAFLESLKGNKLYIAGGEAAVNKSVKKELEEYGKVTRLAGTTRYETSTLIAKTFFKEAEYAVVALGTNFPDGLSGGPLAYAMNSPLLLTAPQKANYAITSKYTNDNKINDGYVLGGPTLLKEEVVKSIFKINI